MTITRGGEDGAGEEEGGGEVPVPVPGGVAEDGDAVVAGLEDAGQEGLQLGLVEAGVLVEEAALEGAELLPQEVLVGELHGGEDHRPEHQVQQVAQHQQREAPGRAVPLQPPHAGALRERPQHPRPAPSQHRRAKLRPTALARLRSSTPPPCAHLGTASAQGPDTLPCRASLPPLLLPPFGDFQLPEPR